MKTMLIATWSEIITENLATEFQNEYQIHTCIRGDDALRLLQELKPDILIITLSLLHITGLSVLQQTNYTPPIIVALTAFLSDSILQEAQEAGVNALIRLPCSTKCVAMHIAKLTEL